MTRGPTIPENEQAYAVAIDSAAQSAVEATRGAPVWPRSDQTRQLRRHA